MSELIYSKIFCSKCGHSDRIDRDERTGETHCACGNYAVDGRQAKYPFIAGIDVVNIPTNYSRNISEVTQRAEIIENTNTSSCKAQGEERPMPRVNYDQCKIPGCDKGGAIHGYCYKHFHQAFGISYGVYNRKKNKKGEDPFVVAARIKGTEKEPKLATKPERDETKCAKGETKAQELEKTFDNPRPVPNPPTSKPENDSSARYLLFPCSAQLMQIIEDRAEQEFRTPQQQIAWYIHNGMKACGAC